MSAEDKAKEPAATRGPTTTTRLSWIRREGQGRVFYEAHGHDEKIYAITPMLEHVLAGIQYALGDLKADDSPAPRGPDDRREIVAESGRDVHCRTARRDQLRRRRCCSGVNRPLPQNLRDQSFGQRSTTTFFWV